MNERMNTEKTSCQSDLKLRSAWYTKTKAEKKGKVEVGVQNARFDEAKKYLCVCVCVLVTLNICVGEY